MTCIIGLVEDKKVYIGGDSYTSDGWHINETARRKIFEKDKFLIGTSGSIRVSQLLRHKISPRRQYENEDDDEYMVLAFADAVRETLKDSGALDSSGVGDAMGGRSQCLVGYKGKLYHFDMDFQVDRYAENFDAVGIGAHFAVAAMMALRDMKPIERIKRALEITSHFCEGVRAPFYVEVLDG